MPDAPEILSIPTPPYLQVTLPPVRSRLMMGATTIWIDSPQPMPNWFRRFWYWALLDWTWEVPHGK